MGIDLGVADRFEQFDRLFGFGERNKGFFILQVGDIQCLLCDRNHFDQLIFWHRVREHGGDHL